MSVPRSVRITGWGRYAPERVLSNADLERLVDTSDEWIVSRTGIRERRIAAPHETTATLSAIAAKRAIAVAGLQPRESRGRRGHQGRHTATATGRHPDSRRVPTTSKLPVPARSVDP